MQFNCHSAVWCCKYVCITGFPAFNCFLYMFDCLERKCTSYVLFICFWSSLLCSHHSKNQKSFKEYIYIKENFSFIKCCNYTKNIFKLRNIYWNIKIIFAHFCEEIYIVYAGPKLYVHEIIIRILCSDFIKMHSQWVVSYIITLCTLLWMLFTDCR